MRAHPPLLLRALGLLALATTAYSAEETASTEASESNNNNNDVAVTTEEPVAVTEDYVTCYQCGDPSVDPSMESETYCDRTKDSENCVTTTKMYNHTCDIMDANSYDEAFERRCPYGVKSCYWAQGTYGDQSPVFRGCAGAHYAHEHKCTRELQAVTVTVGTRSVDVEVHLCYCNEHSCNIFISGAETKTATLVATLLSMMLVLLTN